MSERRTHVMDYIKDKTTYKAVMFARKMIRTGTPAGIATHRAAGYYGEDVSEVRRYVSQAAGTVSGRSKKTRAKPTVESRAARCKIGPGRNHNPDMDYGWSYKSCEFCGNGSVADGMRCVKCCNWISTKCSECGKVARQVSQ